VATKKSSSWFLAEGRRFGRLEIIGPPEVKVDSCGQEHAAYLTRCDCGTEKKVEGHNLLSGASTSCGCLQKELLALRNRKHDGAGSRLYNTWMGMKTRCSNVNDSGYKNYGGRGITICSEWQDFAAFREWAFNSGYRDDLTIERIDVNRGYCPENCTWIPWADQGKNTRKLVKHTAFGETKHISEWSRDPRCVVRLNTLNMRLHRGWPFLEALTTPLDKYRGGRLRPTSSH
jgi:hypothetical protein